jgi:hypothetical protein
MHSRCCWQLGRDCKRRQLGTRSQVNPVRSQGSNSSHQQPQAAQHSANQRSSSAIGLYACCSMQHSSCCSPLLPLAVWSYWLQHVLLWTQ